MPEGPEVHREALKIVDSVGLGKSLFIACDYPPLKESLLGCNGSRLTKVSARGKALVLEFSNGKSLYTHNQLYGRWHFSLSQSASRVAGRARRLRLESSNGWAELYSATALTLGEHSSILRHTYLLKLGPDACHIDTKASDLLRQFRQAKFQGRTLHSLLLDQSFVSGIGNYLRSEILFRCSFPLIVRLKDLSENERTLFANICLRMCQNSLKSGGVTLDLELYRWLEETHSYFGSNRRFYVFDREGESCWVCGERIQKTQLSGRRLYYCAHCQSQTL